MVIKIDKGGSFTEKYNGTCNNDGIQQPPKAFIKHPQVPGSLWLAAKLDRRSPFSWNSLPLYASFAGSTTSLLVTGA